MRVPVQAICNTILLKSFSENISVTPMKLQKLLYFVYREYFQKNNEPLFSEPFETWQYGPVLSSVYNEFSSFHANRITKFAKNADGSSTVISADGAPRIMDAIDTVWDKYKSFNGIELSNITHRPGSAWRKAFDSHSAVLNDKDILEDRVG